MRLLRRSAAWNWSGRREENSLYVCVCVCVCVLCISDLCCGGPGSPMGVLDGMEYDQLYTIH
jgi:hypothetical protein